MHFSKAITILAFTSSITVSALAGLSQQVAPAPAERLDPSTLTDRQRADLLQQRLTERLNRRPHEDVEGTLTSVLGEPIANARVSIRGQGETRTDSDGHFVLEQVSLGDHPIEFQHPQYLLKQDQVRVLPYQPPVLSSKLVPKRPARRVHADQTFTVSDERVDVHFPADVLVFKGTNERVRGSIEISVTQIDPSQGDVLDVAPVGLQAIRDDGSRVNLRSVMMFNVEMFQAGRELEVRRDRAVSVSVKLPDSFAQPVGATIPLWYLDPELGIWTEEANYDAQVTRQSDGSLTAELALPHFSTWNLDFTTDAVITEIKYATNDTSEYDAISSVDVKEVVTSGTAWAMRTPVTKLGLRNGTGSIKTTTNFPQCQHTETTSGYEFEVWLNYSDGRSPKLLTFSNVTAQAGAGTTLGGSRLKSTQVCSFLKDLGAHGSESGYDCSSSRCDGSVCGTTGAWINVSGTVTLDGCSDRSSDYWSNGPDTQGVPFSDGNSAYTPATESFEVFMLRMVYSAEAGQAMPSIDVGYNNYQQTARSGNRDIDADGIPNAVDNCSSTPNKSQADSDKNGIGDMCESWCYVSPSDPAAYDYDYDLDTVDDFCDNIYNRFNPSQWYKY